MKKLRRANTDDAERLVKLIVIAGDGLPYYIWSMVAEDGEDLHKTGIRRALREEGSFSYKNAYVIDVDGAAVSALIGYKLEETVEAIDYDSMPAMFVPFQELENLVPGSWYVNVLATLDDYRCQGFGTELLATAEVEARESGASKMSIITGDVNPAVNIYKNFGFNEIARKSIVKEDWSYDGSYWVLLTKDLN